MDIRLVKNVEEGVYTPIKPQVLLQTVEDDTYRFGEFIGKRMYILNTVTNERVEILPHIKKFNIAQISYASYEHHYIAFTSVQEQETKQLQLYLYHMEDGTVKEISLEKIQIPLESIPDMYTLKIFILDENFILFETIHNTDGVFAENNMHAQDKKVFLYNVESDEMRCIDTGVVAQAGIDKILPLHGNICVIKIGNGVLAQQLGDTDVFPAEHQEIIALINVKQFISDLRLNPENVYMEILDQCDEFTTFPYLIQYGNELVYSRVHVEKRIEEVIIYDYINKVKKVRLNNDISQISDLAHTYVLNDMPVAIKHTEESTEIVNLNTQKSELVLDPRIRIMYILGDLIVTQRRTDRKLLMKTVNYIDVYVYPDMETPVFSTKGNYRQCIEYADDLMIFAN